jgi:hypothetical protein
MDIVAAAAATATTTTTYYNNNNNNNNNNACNLVSQKEWLRMGSNGCQCTDEDITSSKISA